MRVTKWGEYGILCSLYLARQQHDGPIGASEIAEAQQIPIQYTQQILQRLRKGNIIQSVRGPKGGYALTRPPELTTLKEILYAAEGDTFEVLCESQPIYNELCESRHCGLKSVWIDLKRAVDHLLDQRTLASIMSMEEAMPTEGLLVPGPRSAASKES
jgi:Rrf2 family iron-sulfur cluster assembly transcriptional regulator